LSNSLPFGLRCYYRLAFQKLSFKKWNFLFRALSKWVYGNNGTARNRSQIFHKQRKGIMLSTIHFFKVLVLAIVIAVFVGCLPSCVSHKVSKPTPKDRQNQVVNNQQADKKAFSNQTSAKPLEQKKCLKKEQEITADKSVFAVEEVMMEKAKRAYAPAPSCMAAGLVASGYTGSSYSALLPPGYNTEAYDPIDENGFKNVKDDPLSTFSIDVDKASYANVRRFLTQNSLPPMDAVRLEEMINYFTYTYPQPQDGKPFSITTEFGACPWNANHRIALIGLKGKIVETKNLPQSNLVFLIDVSGSMEEPNKLPLIKTALKMLVDNLRSSDHIAIVVYAGAAGIVLPSTPGDHTMIIDEAIDKLEAGGSTAGCQGIELAYATAKRQFIRDGNNRVILATDGDFNVGVSSDGELVRMIEEKRKDGIFLTVLGFGTGNFKDAKMMKLADKGNGNYAYIDNILEAKKVLVSEMGGTLLTIAKDVKIQVEFNPSAVSAYRLIGYEKRKLNNEDFNDDTKDAGELGSGHTVTAMYEIVPAGSTEKTASIDDLKYQRRQTVSKNSDELLTVKFRYKEPQGEQSSLIIATLRNVVASSSSETFRFASAVAGFGMLLRDSKNKGDLTFDKIHGQAKSAMGADADGYRAEFLKLIERAEILSKMKG
jgi:Ca-activated chloride channel family protein